MRGRPAIFKIAINIVKCRFGWVSKVSVLKFAAFLNASIPIPILTFKKNVIEQL